MSHLVLGMFSDSKDAGNAVKELKNKGYTDNISVVAKKDDGDVNVTDVKGRGPEVAKNAAGGATLGALAGLIASVSTVLLPTGLSLFVSGPLALIWGLTGATTGALVGGIYGALKKVGISDEDAKVLEGRIDRGDVLVAVTTDHEKEDNVVTVLEGNNADTTGISHQDV